MAGTQQFSPAPTTPDRARFSRHEHDELLAAVERARRRPERRPAARRQTVAPMVRSRG
jgi:hypothetical protein